MKDTSLQKVREALEALLTMSSWQSAILVAALGRLPDEPKAAAPARKARKRPARSKS